MLRERFPRGCLELLLLSPDGDFCVSNPLLARCVLGLGSEPLFVHLKAVPRKPLPYERGSLASVAFTPSRV